MTAEIINENDNKVTEIMKIEHERENRLKTNKQNLRYLCTYSKKSNICVIGIPVGREKKGVVKKVFEKLMAEICPNL